MTLRVLDPGLYTLVVDFGRPGYRSLGVPVGGAADRAALALGNGLVGNPPDAAALEISLAGPTLEAGCDLACVVFGAPFALSSGRQALAAGTTFTLQAGETLRVGSTPAGMRAYLCVRHGIGAPVVLGSRSTLQPVRAGDELPCSPGTIHARSLGPSPDGHAGGARRLRRPAWTVLRALPGPQGDWFEGGEFFGRPGAFTVAPASNRMGVRLQGEPLRLPPRELVSEPVCPGSVQVTRDGQCIVLGVDGQTIGGYPKVAQVIGADLDRLGQLRPGDRVQFREVTLDEAERLSRRRQAWLREWLTRLRTAEVFR
jgi:5-oxoprolinase (ATP-hydrolysing) subunit C